MQRRCHGVLQSPIDRCALLAHDMAGSLHPIVWRRGPTGGASLDETEVHMNKEQMKGRWKQLKGRAKERWGELTDDDLDQIQGRRQALVGRIQERYGRKQEAVEKEVDQWLDRVDESHGESHREPPRRTT